jgi:glycosyltransferase involved in cell wall biosynthesis
MKKCHILHITYDMKIGGTEQVIRNLVEGLDAQQYKSSILCIEGEIGPWGQELQKKGFQHYCYKRRPGFDRNLIRYVRQLIKAEDFDLIHCHQYTPYTYGWFGSIFTRVPIIFTEHGRFYPDSSSLKRKVINPILQSRTAALTSISHATKVALKEFENFNPDKITVIYNGIADTAGHTSLVSKEDMGYSRDNLILGTISRLDPIKNQSMMLRAFHCALMKNANLRLLIVGDGPLFKELEALVKELGITNEVKFTGFQPNPQDYLAMMDIFLLPSLSEGTSMTLLEAMCFSKPSIATAVGGTPEIIRHLESGYLVENNKVDDLVQAMNNLCNSASERTRLGVNARKRYTDKFTLAGMVHEYQTLYCRLLSM